MNRLKSKKVIVYGTGVNQGSPEEIKAIIDKNFDTSIRDRIDFVYLQGGFNYKALSVGDKILMKLIKFKMGSKKQLTDNEAHMAKVYDTSVDYTKKNKINEVLEIVG